MGIPIPNSKLGLWLFLGTEIMFFTAFIGSYIVLRLGSKGWPTDPHDTHINVFAGGVNTFVLIVSSYLVVVAHEAMAQKNFAKARTYLLGTLLLAFVFLGIKSYRILRKDIKRHSAGAYRRNVIAGGQESQSRTGDRGS